MDVDKFTFWVLIGFWPVWIIWELALLVMRGHSPSVDLLSMVARDRGYQMSSLAFAWGSLAAHFWVNWRVLPWRHVEGLMGFAFFALIAAVFVWDVFLWKTPYATLPFATRVARFPGIMLLLGLANGSLVFPQRGDRGMPF